MYTSDIESRRLSRRLYIKTAITYCAVSILCIVITNVYALFGHGARSGCMDFMFLYPLLGGSLVFMAAAMLTPVLHGRMSAGSRMGYNLYNSGIASLTAAAMLKGIMEIAGTDSMWIQYIKILGIGLLVFAVACMIVVSLKRKRDREELQ